MFADEDLFDIVIRSDTAKKTQKGKTQATQTNNEDLETEEKATTTLTATVSQEVRSILIIDTSGFKGHVHSKFTHQRAVQRGRTHSIPTDEAKVCEQHSQRVFIPPK